MLVRGRAITLFAQYRRDTAATRVRAELASAAYTKASRASQAGQPPPPGIGPKSHPYWPLVLLCRSCQRV